MGVLIDVSSFSQNEIQPDKNGQIPIINIIENVLEECLESNLISDATICKNENQKKSIWSIREAGAESEKKELQKSNLIKCLKHDISLPVASIENFHKDAQKMITNFLPNLKTIYFGHLGDGNLHYNVFGNGSLPDGFEGKSLDPYVARKKYWDLYEDCEHLLPTVPAFKYEEHDNHSKRIFDANNWRDFDITEDDIKRSRRAYFSNISYLDDKIGEIIEALESTRQEATILFLSDHGDMLGERGLWFKMSFYEGSARVPLMICSPEMEPGYIGSTCFCRNKCLI